jgi:hypothetical protein
LTFEVSCASSFEFLGDAQPHGLNQSLDIFIGRQSVDEVTSPALPGFSCKAGKFFGK